MASVWACLALSAAALAVWHEGSGAAIRASDMLLLLAPAAASYVLRLARWYILLRQTTGSVNFISSIRAQMIGFALATTPGRAAEPLKFYLLGRGSGVTVAKGGALLVFERLSDALGLAFLALLGLLLHAPAMFNVDFVEHYLAVPAVLVAILVLAVRLRGRLLSLVAGRSSRWREVLHQFLAANRALLRGVTPFAALGLTMLARLCDALTVYLAAAALGSPIPYPEAALVLGLGGLAGGFSFLPGGIGAAEAVMTGVLVAFGSAPGAALASTVVARVFTYWLWIALGLAMVIVYWRVLARGEKDAHLPQLDPS